MHIFMNVLPTVLMLTMTALPGAGLSLEHALESQAELLLIDQNPEAIEKIQKQDFENSTVKSRETSMKRTMTPAMTASTPLYSIKQIILATDNLFDIPDTALTCNDGETTLGMININMSKTIIIAYIICVCISTLATTKPKHASPSISSTKVPSELSFARPFTITVEGNIGAGKSTLQNLLRKHPKMSIYEEPPNIWQNLNGINFLALMYSDPARWAMSFEFLVTLTMMETHMADKLITNIIDIILSDRTQEAQMGRVF